MYIIISIFTMIGLTYLFTQSDGPFGIIGSVRGLLMRNKYVGVFFYQLFDCPFCFGFWAGMATYLLLEKNWQVNLLLCWGLTSAAANLIFSALLQRLYRE